MCSSDLFPSHDTNGRIMCYFTKKVLNKRFLPNRKNGWNPPVCTDERFRYVEVECGHCFECRKKKRREWRIRNYEQLKETPVAVFFTGTVSPQRYEHICKQYGYKNDGSQDNEIITKIQRLFLERIRKEKGYSIKHWCVTEKDIPTPDVYTYMDYTTQHMEKQSGNLQRRYTKIGSTDTDSTDHTLTKERSTTCQST